MRSEVATSELRRSLGPLQLLLMGIGTVVGAGIFVRTGNAAALHAGPSVILSFLIAGLVCGLVGLCYAELISILPVSAPAYVYCHITLGEFGAWVLGLLLLLEYGLAASVVAIGWSGYMVSLLHDVGLDLPVALTGPPGHAVALAGGNAPRTVFNLPAFTICMAIMLLLTRGIAESARINSVIVIVKLIAILAFVGAGSWFLIQHFESHIANWSPFIPPSTGRAGEFGWSGIIRAATVVFFAFLGFEATAAAALEAKNPQRDMPRMILASLSVATILYVLVAAVLTLLVNYRLLNVADPVAVAVDQFGQGWRWLAGAIKASAIIGLTSVILMCIYGQTRVFYMMARDRLLPTLFARVSPTSGVPLANTVLVGAGTALAAGLFDINTIGNLTSIGTLVMFVVISFSVTWLRIKQPELERGFRVPFFPMVPVAGMLASAALLASVDPKVLVVFGWYLIAGSALYIWLSVRRMRATEAGLHSGLSEA